MDGPVLTFQMISAKIDFLADLCDLPGLVVAPDEGDPVRVPHLRQRHVNLQTARHVTRHLEC